jgi:hypothetical protein
MGPGVGRGFWRRDKSLVPAGIRTPDGLACTVVSDPTTLSRLRFLALFLSSPSQNLRWYLDLRHDSFLPYSMKFISSRLSVILGAFAKLRKATVSFAISVCPSFHPSVGMEQLCSHWTDFREIWYWSIFRKSVEKIQVSLNSDGYFT